MPSSILRGDLGKAFYELRGKQSQRRGRSGYGRKQASVQPSWHFPRGGRAARSIHTTLHMGCPQAFKDPPLAWPCGTVTWQSQPTRQTNITDGHILVWIPRLPFAIEDQAVQSSPFNVSSFWSSSTCFKEQQLSFSPNLPCWDLMPFQLTFFLNEIESPSAKWQIEN